MIGVFKEPEFYQPFFQEFYNHWSEDDLDFPSKASPVWYDTYMAKLDRKKSDAKSRKRIKATLKR